MSPTDPLPYNVRPSMQGLTFNRYAQPTSGNTTPDGLTHVYALKYAKTFPGVVADNDAAEYFTGTRSTGFLPGWDWAAPLRDRTDCDINRESRFVNLAEDGRSLILGAACASESRNLSPKDPASGELYDQNDTGVDFGQFVASGSLYRVDYRTGALEYLSGAYDAAGGRVVRADEFHNYFLGSTPELGTVYFATRAGLLPGIPNTAGSTTYYVYRHEAGRTTLVTRKADGSPATINVGLAPTPLDRPGAISVRASGETALTVTAVGAAAAASNTPMVIDDTNRVHDVYQISDLGEVTWVSESKYAGDEQTPAHRFFEGASRDGRRTVFSTTERLLGDGTTTGDRDSAKDIYMFDRAGSDGALTLVSVVDAECGAACNTAGTPNDSLNEGPVDNGDGTGKNGSAANFVSLSPDGSRVFFSSGDKLAAGDGDNQQSLYVRDVENGRTYYIAPMGAGVTTATDGIDAGIASGTGSLTLSMFPGSPSNAFSSRPLASSTDGTTAVFRLATPVTLPVHLGGAASGGARHLYVWREEGGLRRVREGLTPDALVNDGERVPLPGCWSAESSARGPCRVLSADGRYLVMSSRTELVEGAGHGDELMLGAVYLMDTVSGAIEPVAPLGSEFSGMDSDGRSVFFASRMSLDPGRDIDGGAADIYVSRLGGGLKPPAEPPPLCVGDACQGPLTGALPRPSASQGLEVEPSVAPRLRFTLERASRRRTAIVTRSRHVIVNVKVNRSSRLSVTVHALGGRGRRVLVGRRTQKVSGAGTHRIRLQTDSGFWRRTSGRPRTRLAIAVTATGAPEALRATAVVVRRSLPSPPTRGEARNR